MHLYFGTHQSLGYIEFINYIQEKWVLCSFFGFVKNLYLFQFTMPEAFFTYEKINISS